jgi:hypothetical protein
MENNQKFSYNGKSSSAPFSDQQLINTINPKNINQFEDIPNSKRKFLFQNNNNNNLEFVVDFF